VIATVELTEPVKPDKVEDCGVIGNIPVRADKLTELVILTVSRPPPAIETVLV
jgi:hypothetical protein